MPNIMEISGLLSGRGRRKRALRGLMDLRNALASPKGKRRRKVRKVSAKASRALPGPSAMRMLEIAEKLYADGKKPLALAWAARAAKRAAQEKNSAVQQRALELIKLIRGEAAAKLMAGFGDVDGIVMGRLRGLW
jgi:hypothetical protein